MKLPQELSLQRTTSSSSGGGGGGCGSSSLYWPNTQKIILAANPAYFSRSSTTVTEPEDISDKLLLSRSNSGCPHHRRVSKPAAAVSSLLRSLLSLVSPPAIVLPTCRWLSVSTSQLSILGPSYSLGRKVTGTLFGHRRGHVNFAIQGHSASDPVMLLELAMSTSALMKEMSSGLVRIALECDKTLPADPGRVGSTQSMKLFQEPMWTMYCNGRKRGYAVSRACSESDWHMLRTVQRVSVGAGVITVVNDGQKGGGSSDGELLYMRAKFERVVGSRDSEAFYMLNPDGNGGPELSIFLLRI